MSLVESEHSAQILKLRRSLGKIQLNRHKPKQASVLFLAASPVADTIRCLLALDQSHEPLICRLRNVRKG